MTKISYSGYRFSPEIIHQAIWLYLRFTLSFRDVEDSLAERGIMISYETIRRWVNHFGPIIAAQLRRRRPRPHSIWHLDEVYLKIDGRMVYLWRAVNAEGEVASPISHREGCVTATVARLGLPVKMPHDDLVCAPPVSTCDHPARRLALCAIHAQLSRRGRSAG
jgi:DDE domain